MDITSLLGLPQRQAAEILGISESMLCKRYKECTQRKWPYRYLGKIEKKIVAKQAQLEKAGFLSPSDEATLASLLREREMCLTPVSIRVTESDPTSKKRKGENGTRSPGYSASTDGLEEEDDDEQDVDMMHGEDFNPANVLLALAGGA